MATLKTKTKTLTWLILEKLAELGEGTLDAFLPPQYPEAALARMFLGLDSKRKISRRTFSSILSRLKTQGLVERSGTKRRTQWRITGQGSEWLKDKDMLIKIPAPRDDGIGRLVIFDVPEYARKKRDAIRVELVSANFKQLQKSVWIGYHPLPQDFLILLDELNLRDNVHIFSIRQEGTLQED